MEVSRQDAFQRFPACLLGGIGDEYLTCDAPYRAVRGPAGPPCALLHRVPMARDGRRRHEVDAHGNIASFAC